MQKILLLSPTLRSQGIPLRGSLRIPEAITRMKWLRTSIALAPTMNNVQSPICNMKYENKNLQNYPNLSFSNKTEYNNYKQTVLRDIKSLLASKAFCHTLYSNSSMSSNSCHCLYTPTVTSLPRLFSCGRRVLRH